MKKRISIFIIIAMLMGMLPNTVLFAADEATDQVKAEVNFVKYNKSLAKIREQAGLEERNATEEESSLQWNMKNIGDYTLSYYIQSGLSTSKVKLDFKVKDIQGNVDLTPLVTSRSWNADNTIINQLTEQIQEHVYPYNGTYTPHPTAFEMNIYSNTTDKNELNFVAGAVDVKLKLNNGKITLTTNGIKKGNLTEFNLTYSGKSIGTINAFKGLERFEILPTYLEEVSGNLTSKLEISHPEIPGSKPGVVVKIKRPRYINEDDMFEYMDSNQAKGVNVSLALWPQFTTQGSQTGSTGAMNLHLKFNLGDNDTITSTNIAGKETVAPDVADANVVSIYLAREQEIEELSPALQSKVIPWDRLSESMLVGGDIVLGFTNKPIEDPVTILPSKVGYTYVVFSPTRTGEEEVELEVKPYNINVPVTYVIYEERMGAWKEIQQYIDSASTGAKSNIFITLARAMDDRAYKIEARLNGATPGLESQSFKFNPSQIEERPPVSPILKVDNVYVVPGDIILGSNNKPQPQAIGFDIEWRAPKVSELEAKLSKGNLYYELLLRSTNDPKEVPKLIKVFQTETTTSSAIKILPYAGEAGGYSKEGTHYLANSTFFMPKVAIKNAQPININEYVDNWGWEFLEMPVGYLDTGGSSNQYPSIGDIKISDGLQNIVPGTYYLSMRTVFDHHSTIPLLVGDESNLVAISLDEINQVIPTPDTISSSKNTTIQEVVAQDIFFNSSNIEKYVDNMLEPAKWHLYPKDAADITEAIAAMYSGSYEIFLYQEKPNSGISRSLTETNFNNAIQDSASNGITIKTVDLNEMITLSDGDLKALREGKIIPMIYEQKAMLGQETLKLIVANLDPNQIYNIQIRVKLDAWKQLNNRSEQNKTERSILSKIHSFTTDTKPLPPSADDKVPPAPKKFFIKEQPNNTTVVLGWEKAEFMQEAGSKEPYHEIVRIIDKQLDSTQLDSKKNIEKLIDEGDNSYPLIGFKMMADEIYIKNYTKATKAWAEVSPQQNVVNPELKDVTLGPNTIYYYYIRTVCEIDGNLVRSQWIMVPVTTNPVEAPIQLKVESPKNYSYEPKTETVVSFLAPVPRDAKIPEEYNFEIAVQSELDDEFRLNYTVARLISKENQELMPEGYTHFVYKITGLKPGKRYDIKARVVDKTKPQSASGDYPRSLYSEKVVARTEYDQDDQDRDNKFDEYIRRFDAEAEKLRRNPYWEAESDSRGGRVYKYRESYINAEMAVRNLYELQTEKDINRLTYYFPASMLNKASDLNVVITAVLGNESMSLRPYTLTSDNEAIKEAVSNLNKKKIKDYYIKLDFYAITASTGSINGEVILSPEISIDMEIVYMDEEDMIIEDDIMIELNTLIDRERKDIITQLEKELTKGIINDDRLKVIIEDALADIRKDHQKRVKTILRSERRTSASVNEIEKPILIVSILDNFSVNGYYLEGKWTSVEVLQANGGFGIEAQKLGIYAFTGQAGIGSKVPEIAMYQNIISKYNLTDFFVINAYMIKTGATKKQVYGSVARILGAKRNTDYIEYLKSKGIKGITTIGMDKGIRQDEAVYIIMQAYEIIYKKPINSINIKNKQSVTNIGAFQAQYRTYVYAAVELKIIQNPKTQVLPSKVMSVEEVIKMLSGIVPK